MKKKNLHFTVVIFVLLSIITHAQTVKNASNTNICNALKPSVVFTSDQEPSIKKLKKMNNKASSDEVLDYAIYLHNFLLPKDVKYYDDFTRASTGESYPNQKSIEKEQLEIVKEYILPIATNGNLRAIAFLTGQGYWTSTQAIKCIANITTVTPAIKLAKYQLNFMSYNSGQNKYILALDTLLKSYFLDFNKLDLRRVRDSISEKYNQILKIRKNLNISSSDYKNSVVTKENALKKLPSAINDDAFCLEFGYASITGSGMLSIVPKAFDGGLIPYDACDYLLVLRGCIDIMLVNENPKSFAQILYDCKQGEMKDWWKFDYSNAKDPFFKNDKTYAPIIYKLLSANLPYDTASIRLKSYYLNMAASSGAKDAYVNIACLYNLFWDHFNMEKYNDSCVIYIEKAIKNNIADAYTLKGIKVFNGDGYSQDKKGGIDLIIKAKSMGSTSAKKLLEDLPKSVFSTVYEGYYFRQYVDIEYPWDFKVLCSNNCGERTYPEKIIFGKSYDVEDGGDNPTIKGVKIWEDDLGNPTIGISTNDFQKTFTIAELGFKKWKHVMCSKSCQKLFEQKNDEHFESIKNKRQQSDNEEIKCAACGKIMKRKDMISISSCPCMQSNGDDIDVSFSSSYDLYGDSEPKVCSAECQLNYCKIKCADKGFTSKYK